ncbi:hypothetical protein B0H14DRAFT_2622246 [Mycena olivaceomarginata]|nr:hypothetical protein B0H14DRAFT_2622246 [Mycena olivaceomarginata]
MWLCDFINSRRVDQSLHYTSPSPSSDSEDSSNLSRYHSGMPSCQTWHPALKLWEMITKTRDEGAQPPVVLPRGGAKSREFVGTAPHTTAEIVGVIDATAVMTFHNQFAASYNNNPMTPTPIHTALGDAMNTNTAATRPTRKKRKRTEKNSEANTRRRLNNELGVDAPAVFGVGPLSAGAAASAARIGRYSPPFRHRHPRGDQWTTWKNVKGQTTAIHNHLKSQSHEKVWHDIVLLKQLKGWETLGTSNKNSPSGEHEPFSLPGFYNRLVKWIAVDDQVRAIS